MHQKGVCISLSMSMGLSSVIRRQLPYSHCSWVLLPHSHLPSVKTKHLLAFTSATSLHSQLHCDSCERKKSRRCEPHSKPSPLSSYSGFHTAMQLGKFILYVLLTCLHRASWMELNEPPKANSVLHSEWICGYSSAPLALCSFWFRSQMRPTVQKVSHWRLFLAPETHTLSWAPPSDSH